VAEKRPRMKRPTPVADLIEAVFAGKPVQKRLREMRIWQVWEEAVGQQIAAKAMPAAFRDGTLTVRVSGSAWMQQLTMMKPQIIANLNEAAGEPLVRELFFKQGAIASKLPESAPYTPPARDLTPAESAWIAEQSDSIADPELRRAMESLLCRHLKSLPTTDSP